MPKWLDFVPKWAEFVPKRQGKLMDTLFMEVRISQILSRTIFSRQVG
ncbi:hypothetical protein [Sutcliffiella horikoshii]